MTDKELRQLSRKELLELLLEQSKENDQLKIQLEKAEQKLYNRQLQIDQAGSIAEASIRINQVFEAAQCAAEQYLENVKALSVRKEEACKQIEETKIMVAEVQKRCKDMETETAEKCAARIREAEEKAERTLAAARSFMRQQLMDEQDGLQGQPSPASEEE